MHINLKNKKHIQRGFSLIEMIAVLGIFGIISSVVLFNHGRFTSETVLTNMAYEMALSIREAQIYGVSVRNSSTGSTPNFDNPYGIYIPTINSSMTVNQYLLFKDDETAGSRRGFDGVSCSGSLECITPYTLQRNIFITDIKIKTGSSTCSSVTNQGINIIFERPNPEPKFYNGTTGSLINSVNQVQITLSSRDNTKRFIIISNNGQISVQNDALPSC